MAENGTGGDEGISPDSHHGVGSPVELEVRSLFVFVDEKRFAVRFVEDRGKTDQALLNVVGQLVDEEIAFQLDGQVC